MERQMELFLRGGMFRNVIEGQTERLCAKYGIKLVDAEIILYLLNFPGQDTAIDIRKNFMINKGYLSRRLDALCKKGYVNPTPDTDDRRYVHYPLSEAASALAAELNRQREETHRQVMKGVTEEEMEALERITAKIDRNIRDMIKS